MKRISLNVIDYVINNINVNWWKQIMSVFLKPGHNFEIRCWKNEKEVIEKALKYGKLNEAEKSKNEISINGILSEKMIQDILAEPKPDNYDKWTDFFTINIKDNFCSAHYGAEIYIYDLTDHDVEIIKQIISPIQDFFSFGVFDMEKD